MKSCEKMLREEPNSSTIRQAVANIARTVDPDGSGLREVALPTISGISQRGGPTSRDPDFDNAVEKVIAWYYNRCDQIEEWQRKQQANSSLSRQAVRQRVIKYAANRSDDLQWIGDIQFEMYLSQSQVLDAIEHLASLRAVKVGSENSTGDGDVIMNFRVTSRGRDLADETTPTLTQENAESRKPTVPNFGDEFERIKSDFEKLPVKDEANRIRLLNELETVLKLAFDKDASRYVKQSRGILFYPQILFSDGPDYTPKTWRDGQLEMLGLIESIKHHLSMLAKPEHEASPVTREIPTTNKVFIVHGHDKDMLSAVEAFVNRVGLQSVILMEEANKGRTLVEKFEAHAEASYAIVLLSPDDIGRAASATPAEEKLRPRQNVVLELGYFIGRLGRGRVAAMVDQDRDNQVEYPSDIRGIATIHYSHTNGDWKRLLAKEFRAATLPFNEDRL